MREERGALELRVEVAQAELAREQRALAGGVDDDVSSDLFGRAARGAHAHSHRAAVLEEHVLDGRLLPHLGPAVPGVAQKEVSNSERLTW